MKILIIEDERITANDLEYCIKELRPDYNVIKVLTSVKSAIAFLQKHPSIDLIFSDIQLGDGLSFEIFKKIEIKIPVIFCTAYDEYALEAFDANGIAYLLKPFSTETIATAIEKFENFTQKETNKLSQLFQYFEKADSKNSNSSILVYQGEKIIPLNFDKIAIIYLKDGIVRLHTFDNQKFTASETLEELDKFNIPNFYRANRQMLIHRKAIKNAAKYLNRRLVLHLNIPFKEQIIISKEKSSSFLKWLVKT